MYVAALGSAPWNRRSAIPDPWLQGIGTLLLRFARDRSVQLGYGGRLGLHALPGSESFYDSKNMMDLGYDPNADVFIYDQAGLQQAIKLEQDAGFDIQICGRSTQPKPIDPVKLQIQLTKVRLFSVLFAELRQVLTQANLGAGLQTVLDTGRLLIQQRLVSLSSDEIKFLEPLTISERSDQIRNQATQALFQLLSDSDWQTITDAAMQALQANLTQHLVDHRSA